MNLWRKIMIALIAIPCFGVTAHAQFYTTGSDPGGLKWKQFTTDNYRIIFPKGSDSLARVMAKDLEQVRTSVGASVGYLPNECYRKKMPVVLHNYPAYDNGVVTWAPRRMELLTVPDAYDPVADSWDKALTIHESRHVSQMQFAADRGYKAFNILFGDLFPGAMSAIYNGQAFLEGDAVIAETALSEGGRGRSADFMEYYRVCFDEGDMRSYWKWRWSSLRNYTPDHYVRGYVTIAGLRTFYDTPDFVNRYYSRMKGRFPLFNMFNSAKQISGKKLARTFDDITDSLAVQWEQERQQRAPFMYSEPVTTDRLMYSEYSGLTSRGGTLYAIHQALNRNRTLVRIGEDGAHSMRLLPSTTSRLRADGDSSRIYWSEYKPDLRWEMRSSSRIRTSDGNKTWTVLSGSRYYNPQPDPETGALAVTEYPYDGGSRLDIVNPDSKTIINTLTAPDSLQVVESAWINGKTIVSAISPEGFALYLADKNGFKPLTKPLHVKINGLFSHQGTVCFTSDRTGVNELYSFNPESGAVSQLTNSRNGASDYTFIADTLYFSLPAGKARNIFRTPVDSLPTKAVDFNETYRYPMAETLSTQEKVFPDDRDVEISDERNYSKIGHLMRFHSWAPLYIDYDAVSDLSMESLYSIAGIGATAFFQNDLGTASGFASYSAWNYDSGWRNAATVKFTYTGLFPVFEFNGYANHGDNTVISVDEKKNITSSGGSAPALSGTFKAYVPLNFSSGGWKRGVVPQLQYTINNNRFEPYGEAAVGTTHKLRAFVRGYAMMSTPQSCVYPKFGVGAEVGYSFRPGMAYLFRSNLYGYFYGYLPGLMKTHGIRLTFQTEKKLGSAPYLESFASLSPRGVVNGTSFFVKYVDVNKFTADYKFPFAPLDWTFLGPVAYIRNLEADLHFDWVGYGTAGSMFGAGADLCVVLGNLAWIPYDTRIGVTFNWNNSELEKQFVGMTLSVDL